MPINLNALQQQRRDTASNWTSNNPTLLAGEWGIETDTKKFKIGDGTTAWQSLDYVPIPDVNRLLTGNLTVGGNFTVNGTTTTIDTTTLTVEDKNIEIGKVTTPTDTTADGGGITLKGATDKTFNWLDATDSWTSSENIAIPDNKNFTAGDNQDLQLFHNGTRSEIKSLNVNNFTIRQQFANGFMFIHANQLQLRSHSTNQLYVSCVNNGSVSLFHANVKKVETTADGVDVQGQIHVLGTVPQLRLNSDTNDGSTTRAMLGMATSANNFVNGSAVNDVILNCPKDFIISHGTTEIMAVFRDDGGVELYYDNAKKAETTADGFQIEDNLTISSDTPKLIFDQTSSNIKYKIEEGSGLLQLKISTNGGVSYANAISIGGVGNIFIPDNDKVNFGSGNDLVIVHDGSDSKITNKTGNLLIEAKDSETGIKVIPDGSVELYHDNGKKAETTSTGFSVNGTLVDLGATHFGDVSLANQSDLRFNEATANGSNYVGFQAPANVANNVLWTLPATDAAVSGYALVSDGSGTLSWAAASGGGATGGGGEQIFHESANTMNNDYTISANHNAVVPSPLTINATLTVNSPSVVTFV